MSVYYYGHEAFTRTSRYTLIFITLSLHMSICGGFIWFFHPEDLHPSNRFEFKEINPIFHALVPIAASVAASQVLTFALGIILLFLKRGHIYYVEKASRINDISTMEYLEDEYETIRANWNFLFYTLTFIIFVGLQVASVYFHLDYHGDYKLVWLADIVICFVLEYGIVDTLTTVVASFVSPIGSIIKIRGFHYDYDMHNQFEELEKED